MDIHNNDLLSTLGPNVNFSEVVRLRQQAEETLDQNSFRPMANAIARLPKPKHLNSKVVDVLDQAKVTIGTREDLSDDQHLALANAIQALRPWRKGPFEIFGHQIDAEWQANLKWDRIAPALGNLHGRKILDVGCDNGYYMLRAAAHRPKAVIGFDPSIHCAMKFELMQRFLQNKQVQFERLGHEHLYVFDRTFDIAICMGILYHHPGPVEVLRRVKETIRVGGHAVIESQTIPGEGSHALVPSDRYAKARNVYFVPTKDCLVNWIRKSGFKNVEIVSHEKLSVAEQRSTELMTKESLSDFLDPNNHNLTIEGHPAPYRTVVRAERQFL
jgi:tRNA (mo5U34)-methyltransferase